MRLVILSDSHMFMSQVNVPEGDVLIHCGDALSSGSMAEFESFARLLRLHAPDFEQVFYTPGNHDKCVESMPDLCRSILTEASPKIKMFLHEPYEYGGVKFFGSPYTPRFYNWSFMYDRKDGERLWSQIPDDTNVLFTHGMPYGVLDSVGFTPGVGEERVGCVALSKRVRQIKPKVYAGGHLHLSGGKQMRIGATTFINAAICDDSYIPSRSPIIVEV